MNESPSQISIARPENMRKSSAGKVLGRPRRIETVIVGIKFFMKRSL